MKENDEEENIIKNQEVVKEQEIKNKDSLFEIIKTPEWDKVIPEIIEAIDHKKNDNSNFNEYPYFRVQNAVQYIPKLDSKSDILNTNQLKELHSRLPSYHQYASLFKIFSISIDGSALKSFYNKCEGINNSILLIKDDEGNVFGAYASDVFYPSSTFCGSPDSFLFTFYKEDKIHVYKSTEINNHYMYCDNEQICFGNTDDYFSLSLKNNLLDGYSKTTTTYQNKPLNDRDKFIIVKLEVWGFKEK
jgi:hypothetical protein